MYIDSSLIVAKLCDIAQHTSHGVEDNSNQRSYEAFGREISPYAIGLFPNTHPAFQNKDFIADRQELLDRPFSPEAMGKARPFSLSKFRAYLNIIEKDFLKGDKRFFLGGAQPSTADIHVFPGVNSVINGHKGCEPEVSRHDFPKVYQWADDVNAHLTQAPPPEQVSWEQAKGVLLAPPKHEFAKFVHHDEKNALGLREGQNVTVTPVDTGKNHPQRGELVAVNDEQVCIRNPSKLLMHFPQIGYAIALAE